MKIDELMERIDLICRELTYHGALPNDPDIILGFQNDWKEINLAYLYMKEFLPKDIQQSVQFQLQELQLQLTLELKIATGKESRQEWQALNAFYRKIELQKRTTIQGVRNQWVSIIIEISIH